MLGLGWPLTFSQFLNVAVHVVQAEIWEPLFHDIIREIAVLAEARHLVAEVILRFAARTRGIFPFRIARQAKTLAGLPVEVLNEVLINQGGRILTEGRSVGTWLPIC